MNLLIALFFILYSIITLYVAYHAINSLKGERPIIVYIFAGFLIGLIWPVMVAETSTWRIK